MAIFNIKGKAEKVSKEEIRAMLVASSTVLEFHKKSTKGDIGVVNVLLTERKNLTDVGKGKSRGKNVVGDAHRGDRIIRLDKSLPWDDMFTVVLHEVIHIYIPLPDSRIEKATCMLTNRLKPWVGDIYQVLVEGIYERAGYIAHCKISYKTTDGVDDYDKAQWSEWDVSNYHGEQYRKKVGLPTPERDESDKADDRRRQIIKDHIASKQGAV